MDDEYTQEDLASIMLEQLDFTREQVEANRQYHGKLFLSEDVLENAACGPFLPGETVEPVTGELLKSQVRCDLDELELKIHDVFDRALAAFKNHRSNDVERKALMEFIRFVKCRADVVRIQQIAPTIVEEDDLPF